MTLDGLMFDHFFFSLFSVTFGFVRSKAYVRPLILYDVLMHVLVKGDVFEFIGLGRTKNWIMLCESRQDWFEFSAMYNTCIPHANIMKDVRWEGIKLCAIFGGTRIFRHASGSFKGGRVV